MTLRSQRGFTLIEVVVVAGIIAILAGVLVPLIFDQIDESKKARALADCKAISSAIMMFKKDTGTFPIRSDATTGDVTYLYTNGINPTSTPTALQIDPAFPWTLDKGAQITNHLRIDANNAYAPTWKGPYLSLANEDPWGNAYMVNTSALIPDPATMTLPTESAWVVSAGPDRILHTNSNCSNLNGDDIGVRIR